MRNKLMMSGLMALALGLGVSGTALAYQEDFSRNSDFEFKVTEAINNKDYNSWKSLVENKVGDNSAVDVITKDNFDKFIEAWKLANEGKIKEANSIRRELEHQNI